MTLPDKDHIPGEWHQWRGEVNTKLERIPIIEGKVDAMPAEIEKRMKKVVSNSQPMMPAATAKSPSSSEGQPITFKYAFDKLWPVFVTLGMLLLGYLLRGQF